MRSESRGGRWSDHRSASEALLPQRQQMPLNLRQADLPRLGTLRQHVDLRPDYPQDRSGVVTHHLR